MKRTVFFLVVAGLSILMSGALLAAPDKLALENGLEATARILSLYRLTGGLVLSIGILNLLVSRQTDSPSLRAVLVCNVVNHVVNLVNDLVLMGQVNGTIAQNLPFIVVHVFIAVGSLFFIRRMKATPLA